MAARPVPIYENSEFTAAPPAEPQRRASEPNTKRIKLNNLTLRTLTTPLLPHVRRRQRVAGAV